jgi:hypothetical protein
MSTTPVRTGERWTKAEEDEILANIKAGLSIHAIADRKQRTTGGIRSRLTQIACRFVEVDKMSLYEASGRTRIPVIRIEEAIKWKTEHAKATVEPPQPPKMEFKFDTTFSRQKLQGHAEETRKAEEAAAEARMRETVKTVVAHTIAPQVLNAARTKATSYLWEGLPRVHGVASGDLLRGLKEKFPECTVTLAEEWVDVPNRHPGQPPTRVLKSGIKIDWS